MRTYVTYLEQCVRAYLSVTFLEQCVHVCLSVSLVMFIRCLSLSQSRRSAPLSATRSARAIDSTHLLPNNNNRSAVTSKSSPPVFLGLTMSIKHIFFPTITIARPSKSTLLSSPALPSRLSAVLIQLIGLHLLPLSAVVL